MKNLVLSLIVLFGLFGCNQSIPVDDVEAGVAEESVVLVSPGQQTQYHPFDEVAQELLTDLPSDNPADFGGTVVSGDPRVSAQFNVPSTPDRSSGVFQVTGPSVIDVFYPFDEHATFISGVVAIRDALGNVRVYGPGDSYFMPAGSAVRVYVLTARTQKSFLNVFPLMQCN
jgi:uncharacterized cupin superfamily protein